MRKRENLYVPDWATGLREAEIEPGTFIAREVGVSIGCAGSIKYGHSWKWLNMEQIDVGAE
jgi:hypothetical protein